MDIVATGVRTLTHGTGFRNTTVQSDLCAGCLYCCCDTLVLSLDAGAVNPQLQSEVLSSRRGGYTDLLDSHN
jgi:hypothetical protein